MEPLEEKVACFIRANRLFEGAARILLAVSGGADSVALLHVMRALATRGVIQAEFVCAHVNHQLRGAASDGDEAFVTAQAAELRIPVITKRVDVSSFAKTHKLSIETAARQLRLASLGEIAPAKGCSWIATGHQMNDNAETVLQRLHRGTGFRGLAGIWPTRPLDGASRLARPLLDCGRPEIIAYLQAHRLNWREDETNDDCAHTRNCIRHRWLPELQSQCRDPLVATLGGLATVAGRLHQRVQEQAKRASTNQVCRTDDERSIDTVALASMPEMVAVELIRLQLTELGCGERDLTRRHYQAILELARSSVAGKTLALPDGFLACRELGQIILRHGTSAPPAEMPTSNVTIRIPGVTRFGTYRIEVTVLDPPASTEAELRSNRDAHFECLDLDRIAPPLIVRARRAGDRFQPLGLTKSKKVGKFLATAKVPQQLRWRTFVFEDEREIVWLCPIRISEYAKITNQTHRILAVRVIDTRVDHTTNNTVATEASTRYK